jgi:gliding motility-associated-like protein
MKKIIILLSVMLSPFLWKESGGAFAQNNLVVLNGAYTVLNGGTAASNIYMVVNQPSTSGITVPGGGYIISENQYNYVSWISGTNTGNYVFPFGIGGIPANYIPFTFNKTTAGSANIKTSTWETNPQNMPHPALTDVAAVNSMNCGSMNALGDSVTAVIDRFWDIQTSAAATGNLTFSYLGTENTTSNPTGTFDAEHWNGTSWDLPVGPGNAGVTASVGTVGPVLGQTTFSPWALVNLPTTFTATGSAVICAGNSTPLSASGASSYTWMPAASLSNPHAANPTASPTTTTIYTVTSTNANGCVNSTALTVTITVNPIPTYSLSGNAYTICSGGSQTFSVSGALSYTWTPGLPTLTGVNSATPTVNPTTTTVYSVTGTGNDGCINMTPATVTVTVSPAPSLSLAANSYTICNGSSQTFTASGASTYTWMPTTTLTGANTANPTATPTTTSTIYTVSGTASGCSPSSPLTLTVTLNPLPTYSLTSNTYTICNGASQGLSISGASSYTWTPGSTLTGSNTASPTANPTTTTIYSVTGTDANACTNLTPSTVTVTVNPLPTYSLSSNVYTICNGGSQALSVSGATTYTWSPGLPTLTGSNTANPTANPTTTTIYSVTGTDANACTNPAAATVTVNVTAAPALSLSASSYTICNGSSQTFTASGASTYTWSPPANLDNPSIASPTANPTTTTIYTVNGTASGCAPSPALTLTLTVNPTPTITIAPLGSSSVICNGGSTVITPSGASTYTLNPGNITGTSFTVSPSSSTTYTIDGINGATGCTDAASNAGIASITVNPTPTIGIVPLGSGSVICNGGSVVITPTGASTYTLNPGNMTGTSFTVSPSTTTTYTISGINSATGCANAASNADTTSIIISQTPTITIAPLGSGSVICNGLSTVITPSGASTYTLIPGNITGTSFTVSPTTNTTYTINGGIGSGGCVNSTSNAGTASITVNPTPTITIAPLGSSSIICNGGSTIITPSGASTYTLNPGNQTGTSFTVSPTSSTTYTIDGTNGATGCTDAASNAGIAAITVNPTPTISIVPLGSGSVICNGGSVVITPTGASTYTLNPGNMTGTSFTVSPGTTTTYTISGINSATGCANAASNADTTSILISPTPTITIAPLGSGSVICSGVSTIITPSGASTYTLIPGNITGTSFTVSPTSNTTYTINGSNGAAGCVNPSSNAGIANITVNQTPTLNVTGASSNTATCGQPNGGISGFTINPVNGGTSPYIYQWTNVATGSVVSTSTTSPTFTNEPAGTYSLEVTDANGCIANVTGGSSTFSVPSLTVVASFTTNPNPATGTIPLDISFTNTSIGANTYTWTFGDGNGSSSVNPSNTYTTIGTYTAMLVAINGTCTDTARVTIIADVPTTIIIPNIFSPNGDGINDAFFIINTGMSSLNCDIFNRWGQLLYTLTAPNQSWDGKTPNGDNAPDGTYMYILQAQGLDGKSYKQDGTVTLVR